jgi:y4mF family transcriptional regulator
MIMQPRQEISVAFAAKIGDAVRTQRERLDLRQDELALTAGVSTRVIHQIEHGKPTSRLDSVLPVLDALGLSLEICRQRNRSEGET